MPAVLEQFTDEQLLARALLGTWNAIGYDYESAMRECGERPTNAGAYEMILDAGRLEEYGAEFRLRARKAPVVPTETDRVLKEFRELDWNQQVRKARKLLGRIV